MKKLVFPRSLVVFRSFFETSIFWCWEFSNSRISFYRYLFLTTLKCLLILFIVPFLVNFSQENIFSRPLTEYLEYSTNRNFLKLISTKNVLLQNWKLWRKVIFWISSFIKTLSSTSGALKVCQKTQLFHLFNHIRLMVYVDDHSTRG
jgi:hypothetical protein